MPLSAGANRVMRGLERRTIVRWIEKTLLIVGLLFIGIYVAGWLHGTISSRIALWQFENAQTAKAASVSEDSPHRDNDPDERLWSPQRIHAYKESLASKFGPPLAVLEIPKVQLAVPIFEGTDDLTLNRGVGRIEGTAHVGGTGNVGIAGHRDGFFRVLKDIHVGDTIELRATNGTIKYQVSKIEIVTPEDTRVLTPTSDSELTLVTCYPFYFVGSAPQRFIVHATQVTDESSTKAAVAQPVHSR